MDFEKQMQEALGVIYQNIKALEENREKNPASFNQVTHVKQQQQRKLSIPVKSVSSNFAGQTKFSPRKKRGYTV